MQIENCKLEAPEGAGAISVRWDGEAESERNDIGGPPPEMGLERSRDEALQLEASQVEVVAIERNSSCSSEDAQLKSEGAHVEGVGERNSPCLSEGTQLKVEDAQGERTVRQPNSPHLSEGAQLENEGAQDGPPPEKQPPQNIYAVLVEALQEAC